MSFKTKLKLNNFNIIPGIVFTLIISMSVLPTRLRQGQGEDMNNLIGSQINIFLMCLLCWILSQYLIKKRYYKFRFFEFLLYIFWVSIISLFSYMLTSPFFDDFPLDDFSVENWKVAFPSLLFRGALIGSVIYPTSFFFLLQERKEKEKIEFEKIKQEHLVAQLYFLRQQMNPHFLFNSLNVLKSGTKEEWVKSFVIQLSNTYRYLLQYNNGEDLVMLKDELDFIKSYIYILKERFEDGLAVYIKIEEHLLGKLIPPMTIQTLIENAVKHNVVSLRYPLIINILNNGDFLIVENSIKKTKNRTEDNQNYTGFGLRSLKERYALISNREIKISDDGEVFRVTVPILEKGYRKKLTEQL